MLRCFLASGVLLMVAGSDGQAQGSASPGTVNISATVGGKFYSSAGPGSCRYAPIASIYNVPAALWMVEYAGGDKGSIESLRLTLWRPKDGSPEQLSLALEAGSSSHRIDVGGRGDQVGSGKAALTSIGAGGRFEVTGKDESNKPLKVVVTCSAFGGVEAEGG